MLDHTLKRFKAELNTAMENVLEFRRIIKKYFLCNQALEDSDEDMQVHDDGRGVGSGLRGRISKKYEQEGMGALKVTNSDFMLNLKRCQQELTTVRQRFKHTMNILMKGLSITEN